jgi:hypothetical protein
MSHKAFAPPLSRAGGFEMKQTQEKAECSEKPKRVLVKLRVLAFD